LALFRGLSCALAEMLAMDRDHSAGKGAVPVKTSTVATTLLLPLALSAGCASGAHRSEPRSWELNAQPARASQVESESDAGLEARADTALAIGMVDPIGSSASSGLRVQDAEETIDIGMGDQEPTGAGGADDGEQVETGTDPRDFSDKFMPYFRYTEIENGVEASQLALFGLYAVTPKFAMTYELPIMKQLDYSEITSALPPGQGFPELPSGGAPLDDLESDGDNTGTGDLILRLFGRSDSLKHEFGDEGESWELMPTLEMTFPTASDDVLGSEAWIVSPAVTLVTDLPGPPPFGLGFVAGMNFFDFDAVRDDSKGDTRRYRGRYFWMQPLSKPGPGLLSGLYVLTEVQPIYDFETDDFDLWIGPEFGKVVSPKFVGYFKPGWGIDTEPEDRDFSFEVGLRYFMN
jgi:hypothetical protein